MNAVVADASVAASWFFPDENKGEFSNLFLNINELEIHVPQIFYYEFCNALRMAEKRGRITNENLIDALDLIWKLPIHLDPLDTLSMPLYFKSVNNTAAAHGLTIYDAAYLELSVRLGSIPLLSYDVPLKEAAKKLKIRIKI